MTQEKLLPCPVCGCVSALGAVVGMFNLLIEQWQGVARNKFAPRCPECGSDRIELMIGHGHKADWSPHCDDCGKNGPWQSTIETALDQWRTER